MAKLLAPFDPNQHDPSQGGGGQLPVGKHPVVIVGDEVKANKSNNGGFIEFSMQIIDGPAKGSTGAHRLNLYNQSAQACEIASKQLSAICHATGQFRLGANGDDTSVLHNIPFIIEVGLQKDPDAAAKGYTEVKRVFTVNGDEPGKQPQGQQPAQQQAAPAQQFGQPAQQFAAPQQQAPTQQQPQQQAAPAWGAPQQQAAPAQEQQPAQTGWNQQPAQQAAPSGAMPWSK